MNLTFNQHLIKQLRLSIPIILGQLTTVSLSVADSIMIGNHNTDSLAASAVSLSVFFLLFIFGLGVSFGSKPLVATAYSSGDTELTKAFFKNSILVNLCVALFIYGLFLILSMNLSILQQPEKIIELAYPYMNIVMISGIFFVVTTGLAQYAEALSETQLPMYSNIFGNLLNVCLNYIFIYGMGPIPEMGLIGAGIATLSSRVLMLVLLFVLMWNNKVCGPFVREGIFSKIDKVIVSKLLKMGLPIGIQMSFETSAFAVGALMAGSLGKISLTAHQITLNIASVTYLLAAGISQGATTHIANQIGTKSYKELRNAGLSAILLGLGFMVICAIILYLMREILPTFYINLSDEGATEIIALSAQLMIIAAIFQLSDGLQVVSLGVLRGYGDVKVPSIITFIAYWVISLPLGYFLGIYQNMGAQGIWYGLLTGLTVTGIVAVIRVRSMNFKFVTLLQN